MVHFPPTFNHYRSFKKQPCQSNLKSSLERNKEINKRICDLKNCIDYYTFENEWRRIYNNERTSMNTINIATMFHKAATFFKQANKEDKINFIFRNQDIIYELSQKFIELIHEVDAQSLANTAWAFATLGIRDDNLLRILANMSFEIIDSFNFQNLANTAWAFATLGIRDDNLLRMLAYKSIQIINNFNSQDLSNTAWAFATLGIRDDNLFKEISNRAIKIIDSFNSQDLAITAWAFATLGIRDDNLLRMLADKSIRIINNFTLQSLANTAWAFATLDIRDDNLFKEISICAIKIIDSFNSKDLANISWAFATLGIRDYNLFNKISNRAIEIVDSFNSQDLAITAWAFATLDFRDVNLLIMLANRSIKIIDSFNSQALANISWAFATLGIRDDNLFNKISNRAIEIIGSFNSQALAITAFSFIIQINSFDSTSNESYINLIETILKKILKIKISTFNVFKLTQFYHVYLYMKFILKIKNEDWDKYFINFDEILKEKFPSPNSSLLHKNISKIFSKLDIKHSNEYFMKGYFLDIVIDGNQKIAIEVNGPIHFFNDDPTMIKPVFLLKEKILSTFGWKIKHIFYKKWIKLKDDEEKMNFIKDLLDN